MEAVSREANCATSEGLIRQQPVRRNPQASLVSACRNRSVQGT